MRPQRATGQPRVTPAELDALEAADEARKAIVREASAAALGALRAVALCDMPPAGQPGPGMALAGRR